MKLNIPIAEALLDCKSILIAGMGGGFDIFCGLPIYFELKHQGKDVHLASFSFSDIINYEGGIELSQTLKGVAKEFTKQAIYFPELYLSQWFSKSMHQDTIVWCFHKTGAKPLLENYRILRDYLGVDCIILIDGGVDSLIHGDEPGTGTLIEDATSLYAVNELQAVHIKIVCCIGLGIEPDLSYYHIFENIARLTEAGAFLGSCSLVAMMKSYELYQDAVDYVQGIRFQDPSVVSSSIVSAVQGHYGDYHRTEKTRGSRLWISPLMPIYWFFNLPIVAKHNPYLHNLENTETFMQAMMEYMHYSETIKRRPAENIPLP